VALRVVPERIEAAGTSSPSRSAAKGSTSATFKIVLKTNGRPTTETRNVKVSVR
jgi:hypothetical protein